jgi:site-specific DNA-methyltransferase (adenine-specific)
MTFKILHGDNRDTLKTLADNSIDAIVTDPPYGISFLGKDWDSFRNSRVTRNSTVKNLGSGMRMTTHDENLNFQLWCEQWATECFRVLKPGGYLLSFCAARMYHRMATGLEDAGFEIRDQIMWIYSSGFPKSQDVGRQLHKKEHGRPDKQRFDPAIMIREGGDRFRHPDNGKIYRALPDINGDRLAESHEGEKYGTIYEEVIQVDNAWSGWGTALKPAHEPIALARKPIKQSIAKNVQEWGTGALNIDATRIPTDDLKPGSMGSSDPRNNLNRIGGDIENPTSDLPWLPNPGGRFPSNVIGEILEPYQKYFYCPKVSRSERHMGHEVPPPMFGDKKGAYDDNGERYAVGLDARTGKVGNNHPTVKPVALMEYLIKLITPPGGTVLDPFNGSGSTGMAAVGLGFDYIGCELDPKYVEISLKRIQAWLDSKSDPITDSGLFDIE